MGCELLIYHASKINPIINPMDCSYREESIDDTGHMYGITVNPYGRMLHLVTALQLYKAMQEHAYAI